LIKVYNQWPSQMQNIHSPTRILFCWMKVLCMPRREGPNDGGMDFFINLFTQVHKYIYSITERARLLGRHRPLGTGTSAQNIATIDGDGLAIEVLISGGEEDGIGHVPILTGSGGGDLGLVFLTGDV
jgi:hypothetical protein